jgi:hypothetical protein
MNDRTQDGRIREDASIHRPGRDRVPVGEAM